MPLDARIASALKILLRRLPEAAEALDLAPSEALQDWKQAVDVKLLPRLEPGFPLVAAICGGGSAGKSTLFNSLIGEAVSPAGGRAGLNRRVLAGVSPSFTERSGYLGTLSSLLGGAAEALGDPQQLLEPGVPLYFRAAALPEGVLLLDTPDIDTGAHGAYTNRQYAQASLEASDIFIYIFTNATYNNRDNTDFISRMLTGIGTRPCLLVYRVYSDFSDDDVRDHACTVAENIYGPDACNQHVLGVYRADEDNAVAAGRSAMQLRPLDVSQPADLGAALSAIDAPALRERLLGSIFSDAVGQAGRLTAEIEEGRGQLARYLELLADVQRECVQQALSHFPSDRVLGHFAKVWLKSDPGHIKFMRVTGRVVEFPYRVLTAAVKQVRAAAAEEQPRPMKAGEGDPAQALEIDLLNAANRLYQQVLEPRLETGGRRADAPSVVRSAQQRLRRKDWQSALAGIQASREAILSWSSQLESELKSLADTLRGRMGLWGRVRQTFSALLNVIPATAAITYILHTGDLAGAAGIKIKLTGLFGLNDLYALIAIPATAGMKKADRRQLDQLLAPVAATWLQNKLRAVDSLFEEQISGEVLRSGRAAQQRLEALGADIQQALRCCREGL